MGAVPPLNSFWSCFCLLLVGSQLTNGHVVLTYPPARRFGIDGIDNSTFPEPCGMPKGPVAATFLSGKPVNITWRLAYPNQGGYRLQLLDNLSRPVLDLTPVTSKSEFVTFDEETEHMTVKIPSDFECENCTMRLVRKANEGPQTKWFLSCSDVDIKTRKMYKETCSNHGRYLLSKCHCDRLYYGKVCQYKDECVEHRDCGEMGRCVNVTANSPPRRQCYCELGWFGPGCNRRSRIKSLNTDLSAHMYKELNENVTLYWRLMVEEGEIEIALKAKTTNYVAVGWRPQSLNSSCQDFPLQERDSISDASEDNLHPMACTDMVIGMARATSFNILDYYSRDLSTPKVDTYWGGKNDLTAAMGFEKDGVTTIVFRKKIKASEPTDHSIIDEEMHVIWAVGQNQNENPVLNSSTRMFYTDDSLLYHGHIGHRGTTSINFFVQIDHRNKNLDGQQSLSQSYCKGDWKTPKNCNLTAAECEYSAAWDYSPKDDVIHFTITTKNADLWTGIAFSTDHKMTHSDAIIGLVDKNGRAFVMDTWIVGRTSPSLDFSQDISNVKSKTSDGVTTLSFDRKRSTGDSRDLSFTDDDCLYMMFPVKGGEFNAVNKKIRQHKITPIISSHKVCIRACNSAEDSSLSQSRLYQLDIKLANLGTDFKAPKPGSSEFSSLSQSMKISLAKIFNKYGKSVEVEVREFVQDGKNIIPKIDITLKDIYKDASVRKTIEQAVNKGRIGTIAIEPGYWKYELLQDEENNSQTINTQKSVLSVILKSWIVLGCLIALLVLIVMQAMCTICKRSSKYDQKDVMFQNIAWKDYSSSGLNYDPSKLDTDEKIPGTLRNRTNASLHQQTPKKIPQVSYIPHNQKTSLNVNNNYNTKSLQRPTANPYPLDRTTHSLPRAPQLLEVQNGSTYTHGSNEPQRNGKDQVQPDFYFMPSQRKYSGEVVRVYVDYDTQNK